MPKKNSQKLWIKELFPKILVMNDIGSISIVFVIVIPTTECFGIWKVTQNALNSEMDNISTHEKFIDPQV